MKEVELLVVDGPLKGRRVVVSAEGVRMGRSSSCEISVPDLALSRNHCLFECRDGKLWVTDLASANGTRVNDVELGADSWELKVGDRVFVGETEIAVVRAGEDASASAAQVDLGFGGDDETADTGARPSIRRLLLWVAAALAVAGAAMVILTSSNEAPQPAPQVLREEVPELVSFSFEKVEADAEGIYRYALSLDRKGVMTVAIDDVPKENRHVDKSQQLSSNALARLEAILSAKDLRALDPSYSGVPAQANTLRSFSLRVVRSTDVFSTEIENAQEPEAFLKVREQLETFSKNELGMWAIQYSAEKLLAMSAESRRVGDSKWQEKDAQYGNCAAALAAYDEAIVYLETVNPKPSDYGALVKRRGEVAAALEKKHADQRFVVDRAIKLQDWQTARRELRVLCELVPDAKDPRHAEAEAKLLDVESRIKKGDR